MRDREGREAARRLHRRRLRRRGQRGSDALVRRDALEGVEAGGVGQLRDRQRLGGSPGDFASASGKLTFAPGETEKTINVSVVGETVYEQDETLIVSLSGPVQATIGDGSATADDHERRPGVPHRSLHRADGTGQADLVRRHIGREGRHERVLRVRHQLHGGAGVHAHRDCPDQRHHADQPRRDIRAQRHVLGAGLPGEVEFAGKLTGPSSASGTFKLAIELDGFDFGTLHCQSGSTPLTWNAS